MGLPTTAPHTDLSFQASRRGLLTALAAALLGGCAPLEPSGGGRPLGPTPPRVVARLRYWDSPSQITVERGGRAISASDGMGLVENDIVETRLAYARIEFPDADQVWLDAYTRVRVGSLWLFFGRLLASVSAPFRVETEDVTASPEGTTFGVRRDRSTGAYAVAVETGRVRCTGKRVSFQYVVRAGEVLVATPRTVPSAPRPGNVQAEIGWVRSAMRGGKPAPPIR